MKSYIEPMSAADALDVLRVFCEPFGDLSYSYNNDEDAVLHGPDGDKVLKTPDEVIAVMGDDATREIAEHKRFRERAVRELMVPVLSEWGSIYNVRTGETFILDSNCEGKLYGFYCTETPLATLVDEGEDGIPYDAALYAIETRGADMQHLDALPGSELPDPLAIEAPVADDDFVGAIDTVLCYMEQTAIDLELGGDLFDLSGWTLADGKSIAATCSRLGIDASPKLHTDPASVADAAKRAADACTPDTPGAFLSGEHEGCVEVELSGHTVLLETPDSVKTLFGHDAAAALRHHANFRKDAAEIMGRALDLDDFLYNIYSGTAFIPDTAPDGEFFGFHVASISLTDLLEEDIDPLSPDVCDHGLDFIAETIEGADAGDFEPCAEVDDEKFLTSVDWALYDIECSVLATIGAGCSPKLAGWTLGNADSITETCAMLGVDMSTVQAPDDPASVAAAAKAAAKSGGTADEPSAGIKL